jgi:hypothetical protein
VDVYFTDIEKTIQSIHTKEETIQEKKLTKFINNNSICIPVHNKSKKTEDALNEQKRMKKEENLIKEGNKLTFSVPAGRVADTIKGGDYVIVRNVIVSNSKDVSDVFYLNCDGIDIIENETIDYYLKAKFEKNLEILKIYDQYNIEKMKLFDKNYDKTKKDDYGIYFILPSKSIYDFYPSDIKLKKRILSTTPTVDEKTHSIKDKTQDVTNPNNWNQYMYYVFDIVDIQDRSDPNNPKYKRIKFKVYITQDILLSRGFPSALIAENMLLTHDIPSIYYLTYDVDAMSKLSQKDWLINDDLMEGPVDPSRENYILYGRCYGIASRFNEYLLTYGVTINISSAVFYLIEKYGGELTDELNKEFDKYIKKEKDLIIKSINSDTNYINSFNEKDLVLLDTYTNKSITPYFDEKNWCLKLLIGGPKQNAKTLKKMCETDENMMENIINEQGPFENLTFSTLLYAVKIDSDKNSE